MSGLFVVGASHAADERAAGEALAGALAREGHEATTVAAVALGPDARPSGAVHAHAAVASPVTAARHDDVDQTYKVGRGAAFVVGEDYRFVNFYNPHAAGSAGQVECTYVQNETGFEGATTSRIVGGGK